MKIVALIPARAGSKRLKGKNSKKLLGRPLISWTINTIKKVNELSDIFVSTDDDQIIRICKKHKIKVPWKRPKKLCGDKISSVRVALHFINWYEKRHSKLDGLLWLQPTSPFREKSSIKKAIKIFSKNKQKAIVSFKIVNKEKSNLFFLQNKKNDSPKKITDRNKMLKLNGSIYLISPKNLKKYKSFFKPSIIPIIQNSAKESIDIDTYNDWKLAEKQKKNEFFG